MAGFLALFDEQRTITVERGDVKREVVIRRYLSQKDFNAAQEALLPTRLLSAETNKTSRITSRVDSGGYNQTLLLKAIVSWTIDDASGSILPIDADSLQKLPQVIFRQILEEVLKDNNEEEDSAEAQTKFRSGSDAGDSGSED